MNRNNPFPSVIGILLLVLAGSLANYSASAQSTTAFTYQGELMQNGNPANGSFNMEFTLWSLLTSGTQLASQTINNVQVVGGRFTVVLDLESENFITTTANRYLQIRVNGTTLSPRTLISRTPYALQTRGIQVNEAATFVGIRRSDRINTDEVFGLFKNTSNLDPFGGMYVETNNGGIPFYGYATSGSVDAYHYFDDSSSSWRLWAGGDRIIVDRASGDTAIGGKLAVGGGQTLAQLSVRDTSPSAGFGIDVENTNVALPAIVAENAAGGPVIWALGTDDVTPAGGGLIVAGAESGPNIAIDGNEIMARNNGSGASIFINSEGGGKVFMGENVVQPAFAYGRVNGNGAINSSSSNVTSVQRVAAGRYTINVQGGSNAGDVIVVTSVEGIVNALPQNGGYDVVIQNFITAADIDSVFFFLIYRP